MHSVNMSWGDESPEHDELTSPRRTTSGQDLRDLHQQNVEALRSLMGHTSSIMSSPSPFSWGSPPGTLPGTNHPAISNVTSREAIDYLVMSPPPVIASHQIKTSMDKTLCELDKVLERVNLTDTSPFDMERPQCSMDQDLSTLDSSQLFGNLKALQIKAIRHHLTALDLERYLNHGQTPSLYRSVSVVGKPMMPNSSCSCKHGTRLIKRFVIR